MNEKQPQQTTQSLHLAKTYLFLLEKLKHITFSTVGIYGTPCTENQDVL